MMVARFFLTLVIVVGLTVSAWAQTPQQPNPLEQRVKMQLGELILGNSMLQTQLEDLQKRGAEIQAKHDALVKENAELKSQIEQLQKAAPK